VVLWLLLWLLLLWLLLGLLQLLCGCWSSLCLLGWWVCK
jgi:hypothetical protein